MPAGAQAGQLILEPCSYATENGSYDAECGTLVVPENRADPQSRLIALPVTRIRARSDHPAEPIFRLEGGPGLTNMKFKKASQFADKRTGLLRLGRARCRSRTTAAFSSRSIPACTSSIPKALGTRSAAFTASCRSPPR